LGASCACADSANAVTIDTRGRMIRERVEVLLNVLLNVLLDLFPDVFMFTLPPLPCRRSEKPNSEKPYNAILETASPQKAARTIISTTLLTGFTHFVLLKISKIAYRAVVLARCGPSL
jgi:hypothetical protein